MLPRIHLGTLMTVTDVHVADKTRKRKQAVMEARVSKSMEGFYIYQTYLKRLRRMHRAYVTKIKQQQTQNAAAYSLGSQHHRVTHLTNQNQPLINHRLSLAGPFTNDKELVEEESPDAIISLPHQVEDSQDDLESSDYHRRDGVSHDHYCNCRLGENRLIKAIRIPCGREDSFEITSKSTPKIGHRIRERAIGNGYLPFRLWKQNQTNSLYNNPSFNSRKMISIGTRTNKMIGVPSKHGAKPIDKRQPRLWD